MNEKPQFAGHRMIRFSSGTRDTLVDVARRLIPHKQAIVDKWVSRQFKSWEPPGLTRESLGKIFGDLWGALLEDMLHGRLESCIENVEQAGTNLAGLQFPFDALIISIHFLEESYLPLMLNPPPPYPRRWLVTMDEFLHVVLAALADAYFDAHRQELLDRAEVGRIVQEGLMPHIPKKIADVEVAYTYISAHEQAQLGGDFLDAFSTGSGSTAFIVGDLSGHGLEAVADSVTMRSIFRGFMREQPDLAAAMMRLNLAVGRELDAGQFATAVAFEYHPGGRLGVVSAGHPYPVLVRDGKCGFVKGHAMILGIMDWESCSVSEQELRPGDVFVAYTDGLTEARRGKDMFGDDRLLATVDSVKDAPARGIADALMDSARRHAGGRFVDDAAVLVLRRVARPRSDY